MYNEGDFLIREPGDVHPTIRDPAQTVSVFLSLKRRLGSKGLGRVLNPFMRFQPS